MHGMMQTSAWTWAVRPGLVHSFTFRLACLSNLISRPSLARWFFRPDLARFADFTPAGFPVSFLKIKRVPYLTFSLWSEHIKPVRRQSVQWKWKCAFLQGGHKPGVLWDFSEHGKLREFCVTSGKNANKQSIFSWSFEYLCKTSVDWVNRIIRISGSFDLPQWMSA